MITNASIAQLVEQRILNPMVVGSIPATRTNGRVAQCSERLLRQKVGGSNPSPSTTNLSPCSSMSERQIFTLLLDPKEVQNNEYLEVWVVSSVRAVIQFWFNSHQGRRFRKGSSVVFRAPYGFGHKEVGGSSPSPSTSLRAGSSIRCYKLTQVSDHSLFELSSQRALRPGKQGNTVRLAVSKLLEILGDYVGSNPAPRTNFKGIVAQRLEHHITLVVRRAVGSNPPYLTKIGEVL